MTQVIEVNGGSQVAIVLTAQTCHRGVVSPPCEIVSRDGDRTVVLARMSQIACSTARCFASIMRRNALPRSGPWPNHLIGCEPCASDGAIEECVSCD